MKIIILLVLTLALTSVANAQSSQLGPIRVTLVAGPSPSKGGRVEVVRRAQRTPRDLIIVDRNATAVDLAAGLATLNALRTNYGDSITTDLRARPDVARPGKKWARSEYHGWLIEQLVRLRATKPASYADLGVVSTIRITLPAPQGAVTSDAGRR